MKAVSCNQRKGGHREALSPGAPQGPAQYQQSADITGKMPTSLLKYLKGEPGKKPYMSYLKGKLNSTKQNQNWRMRV